MKKNKKAVAVAALAGVGALSWMMYKKKNPDVLEDMKKMTKEAASSMLTKLENME